MWIDIRKYPKCTQFLDEHRRKMLENNSVHKSNSQLLHELGYKSIQYGPSLPIGIYDEQVHKSNCWFISDDEYPFFILRFGGE